MEHNFPVSFIVFLEGAIALDRAGFLVHQAVVGGIRFVVLCDKPHQVVGKFLLVFLQCQGKSFPGDFRCHAIGTAPDIEDGIALIRLRESHRPQFDGLGHGFLG